MHMHIDKNEIRIIYDDILDNINNNHMRIERLSHIEFDNDKKLWNLTTPDFKVITSHKSRTVLLKAEVIACSEKGIEPLSLEDKEYVETIISELTKEN